ncbi:hypothetical protein TNCV_165101 [Trichonephila clavipes]|nr:hypothetical protein TNCV_165101 [Trichonephila clavipes]
MSVRLSEENLVQVRIKCLAFSIVSQEQEHWSVGDKLKRFKYALKFPCPVRNWRWQNSYRNCNKCLGEQLTSVDIFDCPAILDALQEIGVLLSSKNLYVDNIEQFARIVIWARGTA